ncbi:hypothetical protein PLICRDRAFT_180908 [Plicaturopsis crispa FD-325 SS-3]|uniref:Uncharacterized protein n=1 Tax=Plicaturopsis crispa FD-325 SS-3 TaxID=944288 RepID=A0A0C9T492_PLICR|nr:hypothetical protein PLICRDRAFT_180908 [Plicaturopsis crispa FD-325 SS-3]
MTREILVPPAIRSLASTPPSIPSPLDAGPAARWVANGVASGDGARGRWPRRVRLLRPDKPGLAAASRAAVLFPPRVATPRVTRLLRQPPARPRQPGTACANAPLRIPLLRSGRDIGWQRRVATGEVRWGADGSGGA